MADSLLDQVLGPGGSSAPMPMAPTIDPNAMPGQPGSIYGGSGFPSDPQTISALNSMGNLAPQQQLGAISSYYGYDPSQVASLFQQPQSDNRNRGAFGSEVAGFGGTSGQPITPGGGPSGQAMSAWQAFQNGSIGPGMGGDVGGISVAARGPSPGMPGYSPGTSLGFGGSTFGSPAMTGLYPPGVLPPWLISQIPQMMAANANGGFNQNGYYDTYAGSFIPPGRGGMTRQAWHNLLNQPPAGWGDTSGPSQYNLDRFGRPDTPYIVS